MSKSSPKYELGLIRTRHYFDYDRRQVLKGMGALAALSALGGPYKSAYGATNLHYLGWQGYDTFFDAGNFLKKNDISVNKSYISSSDEVNPKLRLHPAQINICTPYFLYDHFLASEGLLEPLDLDKIPNFQNVHPIIKKKSKASMAKKGVWYAAPVTYGSICMLYNADRIPKPTSWTDMLKDEYKGKCAITSDSPGNLFAWARVAGFENPTRLTHEQLKKTTQLLIDLKKNHLRAIASSYGALTDMLASEEIVICQGWEPVCVWVGDKPTIKPAYPKERCLGYVEGYSIGKGSPNRDAAYKVINHGLSLEGQISGAEANSLPTVNATAMTKVNKTNRELYQYDEIGDYFTEKTQIVPMYPLYSNDGLATWADYQAAWQQVLKS